MSCLSQSGRGRGTNCVVPWILMKFGVRVQFVNSLYSLFHGFWQSLATIGSCNHLMRIISTYVGNTKKSEIS